MTNVTAFCLGMLAGGVYVGLYCTWGAWLDRRRALRAAESEPPVIVSKDSHVFIHGELLGSPVSVGLSRDAARAVGRAAEAGLGQKRVH